MPFLLRIGNNVAPCGTRCFLFFVVVVVVGADEGNCLLSCRSDHGDGRMTEIPPAVSDVPFYFSRGLEATASRLEMIRLKP